MTGLSENVESVFPLSPTQEGMLYHTLHSPGSGVYIGQHVIELEDIDSVRLRKAWQLICNRHMALRSVFAWEGLSRSVQLVLQNTDAEWHEVDLRGKSIDIQAWCNTDIKNEFDVSDRPPSRISLLSLDKNRFLLVWTRHHLMMDGWSAYIVLNEIKQTYAALAHSDSWTPHDAPGFSTYIAWLQQQNLQISEDYWRSILSNLQISTGLESIRRINRGARHSRRIERHLGINETEQLTLTARRNNLTLSTLVHGAWSATLFAVNESLSLIFGSTVSGRPETLPGRDEIVGNFINTIPILINADTDDELSHWLRKLQQQITESARHGHLANRQMLQSAGILPGTTLFDSIVVFMNYPQSTETNDLLAFKQTHYEEHSHYPLAILAVPGESLQLIVIHDSDLIAAEKADRLLDMLTHSLQKLPLAIKGSSAHYFDSLRPRHSVLHSTPLQVEPISVVQRLIDTAIQYPDEPAVRDTSGTLTYSEFTNAIFNLASILTDNSVQAGDHVVISMPRTIEGVVGIWATLLCGATYVPVAPTAPRTRLISLYSQLEARLLISHEHIPDCESLLVLDSVDINPCAFEPVRIDTEASAYVIFTSGSTGEPKAISVSHSNLAHSLAARLQYYGDKAYNYALLSPFAFDSSVAGIFWTAATGGCLTLISERSLKDPSELIGELSFYRISALLTLPSIYQAIVALAPAAIGEHLDLVIVAGEACPENVRQEHFQLLPDTTLVNEYGPTEATVWCCSYQVEPDSNSYQSNASLPIGSAIPGVKLHVLDQFQRPVPQGVIGELYVEGPTVTQSNKADGLYATGDLVEVLPQGVLIIHGRRDDQLKIRGHRVDPTEVEAILRRHPGVVDCAVTGRAKPLELDIESLNSALNTLPHADALEVLAAVEAEDE